MTAQDLVAFLVGTPIIGAMTLAHLTAYLVSSFATAVSFGVLFWTRKAIDGIETAPAPTYDDRAVLASLEAHADAIEDLQEKGRAQTLAIAEGIERVDRSERRVRAVVGRAQKRFEDAGFEDAALESEAAQLHAFDGDGGEANGVPSMHPGVDQDQQARDMSAFPGRWS